MNLSQYFVTRLVCFGGWRLWESEAKVFLDTFYPRTLAGNAGD